VLKGKKSSSSSAPGKRKGRGAWTSAVIVRGDGVAQEGYGRRKISSNIIWDQCIKAVVEKRKIAKFSVDGNHGEKIISNSRVQGNGGR